MLLRTPTVVAAACLSGCVNGAIQAPDSAIVLVPEDYEIAFSSDWNDTQDGAGLVLFGDIQVYDQDQDLPLEKVEVETLSSWGGVYVIPAEAVLTVDFPSAPDDAQDNYDTYCYDDNGTFDPSENEWCAWYYDVYSQSYYQIGTDYADANGYGPNYFRQPTDNRGLVRIFLYVDSLPTTESGALGSATIYVTIGVDTASFSITGQ